MRRLYACLLPLLLPALAWAQAARVEPDTLLQQHFHTDPSDTMLLAPGGFDLHWVNYDADQIPADCDDFIALEDGNWFWDIDLSADEFNGNSAFTSCSVLEGFLPGNRNWLITSPVYIPDSTYFLCWRSLPLQGPFYLDGYKVLVSTNSNDPGAGHYTDTLLKAAQMIEPINPDVFGSLELSDYIFSDGYIHANGYTDTSYFFVDYIEDVFPPIAFYHGRFEPHTRSLKKFAGQTVYIAFLHDSDDDAVLQLDDIVVANDQSSAVQTPGWLSQFSLLPNPARDHSYAYWTMPTPQSGRLLLTDANGRLLQERRFAAAAEQNLHLDLQTLAPGLYTVALQTESGVAVRKLVKY